MMAMIMVLLTSVLKRMFVRLTPNASVTPNSVPKPPMPAETSSVFRKDSRMLFRLKYLTKFSSVNAPISLVQLSYSM